MTYDVSSPAMSADKRPHCACALCCNNMEVFVSSPGSSFSNAVFPDGSLVRDVLTRFVRQQGGASSSSAGFYVVRNGRLSPLEDPLQPGAVYHLEPRLCGGKGGFGSMLRALGAQIEKTTNREACRDLSGRRLRDVNHEKEMAEWLKNQAEREAEKEQRRVERLHRKRASPQHQFSDPEYQRQCHDLSERLEDSVMKGLQVEDGSKRRSAADGEPPQKKKQKKKNTAACFWTGVGEMLSSEEEDEEEEEQPEQTSSSSDHQTSRTAGGQGPPETPRDQTSRPPENPTRPSEDQGPSGTPTDQTGRPSEDQDVSPQQDRPLVDLASVDRASVDRPLVDLASVDWASVDQLESLGLEVLKEELMSRGLKCGGTLKERAQRLFSVRGLTPDQIDPAALAKPRRK
ncbi:splicing regulator SDE2 isoform X2 [Pseudoliparis swirei]|uniref:splicing regulator SDE2 isoform X2 n=1 Tax=Pseudoliparis swirei TaxID=2059687 RepID=UPI0024BE61A7|nr:splicing regulator SDE2 isoform X2 [Pseudoliparis swirei]